MDIKYLSDNLEYVGMTSRYEVLRVISENKSSYLETYNQIKVPQGEGDQYHIVEDSEVGRLDLIAYKYYSDSSYWWAIALANDFIDPFALNKGVMIRIPSLLSLVDVDNGILNRRKGASGK